MKTWFRPRPWTVSDCRIDLRPSGEFYTLMAGPAGEKVHNHGCYLEVIEHKKLVWTGMMTKGFRPGPVGAAGFHFVATILFSRLDEGSSYKAILAHVDEEGRQKHEQMGFQHGWGLAYDQLVLTLARDQAKV